MYRVVVLCRAASNVVFDSKGHPQSMIGTKFLGILRAAPRRLKSGADKRSLYSASISAPRFSPYLLRFLCLFAAISSFFSSLEPHFRQPLHAGNECKQAAGLRLFQKLFF